LLKANTGDRLVDVGCGTGLVVAELTERGIKAMGVDISEQMITVARHRFPDNDFLVAAAESLPFEDGSLDGYRAERLYQHLKDPAQALVEARRVLKPGGSLLIVDQDYDMWAIDSDDETTTRTVMQAQSNAIASRWIGRRCRNLFLDAGFVDVAIEVKTLISTDYAQLSPVLASIAQTAVLSNAITHAQAHIWLEEQRCRGENSRFFFCLPFFLASARQP